MFSFKPLDGIPHVRQSTKLNVCFAVSSVEVYGPLLLAEQTATGISYMDTLENCLMPQLQQDKGRDFILQ